MCKLKISGEQSYKKLLLLNHYRILTFKKYTQAADLRTYIWYSWENDKWSLSNSLNNAYQFMIFVIFLKHSVIHATHSQTKYWKGPESFQGGGGGYFSRGQQDITNCCNYTEVRVIFDLLRAKKNFLGDWPLGHPTPLLRAWTHGSNLFSIFVNVILQK